MSHGFSLYRLWAIMRKEFVLMRRDPALIVIMAVMPLILVCIAGFAVNIFPEKIPAVLVSYDQSPLTQKLTRAMENTRYIRIVKSTQDEQLAYHWLRSDQAMLIITIPADFTRAFYRQEQPAVLIEDGGLDGFSTARALVALQGLARQFAASNDQPESVGFRWIVHRLYDPDMNTRIYVVPGMIGLVLMLTMLMITVVIAFRDLQGGTIEYLLASPTRPSEILIGEILAYLLVGYVQLSLGLFLAQYLFAIPFIGSYALLYLCVLPYLIAELALGLTIATFCATQFQAVQLINVFIAFSIILSGFVFPLIGMPDWAQTLSQFLPLTYFFKMLFAIMLKGSDLPEVWQHLWPLLAYCLVMISLATLRFKHQSRII